MSWVYLIGAILSEVTGTLSLRASEGGRNKKWLVLLVASYVVAFGLFTLSMANGMALGVAYGIWAASGVALTAIASRILFNEALTKVMGLGIVLIVGGVLLIELGAAH